MQTKHKPMSFAVQPLAYRITDATHMLGIGKSKLYQLAADGKLKLTKIGGRTVITRSELKRLLRPSRLHKGARLPETRQSLQCARTKRSGVTR